MNEDASDPGYQLMSDQDIIETVMMNPEDSDSEDDDPSPPTKPVTHAQACDAFQCAFEWLEQQGDTDPAHLMLVKKWRDRAAQCCEKSRKQTKITSYFK